MALEAAHAVATCALSAKRRSARLRLLMSTRARFKLFASPADKASSRVAFSERISLLRTSLSSEIFAVAARAGVLAVDAQKFGHRLDQFGFGHAADAADAATLHGFLPQLDDGHFLQFL